MIYQILVSVTVVDTPVSIQVISFDSYSAANKAFDAIEAKQKESPVMYYEAIKLY